MTFNMELLKLKLSASSIIEVVIAMVLIMIVFGISMVSFTNVIRSSTSYQVVNANLALHHLQSVSNTNLLCFVRIVSLKRYKYNCKRNLRIWTVLCLL